MNTKRRVMTIAEFRAFLARRWSQKNTYDFVDCFPNEVNRCYGFGRIVSKLDGVTITWNEGYEFRDGEAGSLIASTVGLEDHLLVDGLSVIDEDGEDLYLSQIEGLLPASFVNVDYSDHPCA
jgi:hypothetical protein